MKTYTYHRDLRLMMASIGKVLDGIVVRRYSGEGDGKVVDDIAVPVKYAPKSRVIHALTNLSNHIQLPVIAYQMKGVTWDENRVQNKISGFTLPKTMDRTGTVYPEPVPVNVSVEVSFLGRFATDAEQFISCLYTNFNKYVVVSYEYPALGTEVRSKFIWDGTVNLNYPDDLDATKPYRFEVTSNFTFEGWLFKNFDRNGARIYNIPISFEAVPEITWTKLMNDDRRYFLDDAGETFLPKDAKFETETVAANTDFRTVSGRPWVRDVSKDTMDADEDFRVVQIRGNMFETTSAVVFTDVSGRAFPDSEYSVFDFYSKDKSLSGFGVVTGVSAPYEVIDDHTMLVEVPKTVPSGGIADLKVLGEFGIGSLMGDSVREYIAFRGVSGIPSETLGMKLPEPDWPTATRPIDGDLSNG